jgi:hypothetical protein
VRSNEAGASKYLRYEDLSASLMNRTVSALKLYGEPVPSDRFPNRLDLHQVAYAAQLGAFRAGPITFTEINQSGLKMRV